MTETAIRLDLSRFPDYAHGTSIPDGINLAANELATRPVPAVLSALTQAVTGINRYPAPGPNLLLDRVAHWLDVPREWVAVSAGSAAVCQQLIRAVAADGGEVVFGWPSFEAYPLITQIAGAVPRPVALTNGVHDLAAMADAVTSSTRLVIVCNPNNPTGTMVTKDELLRFLHAIPSHVVVVLDEAYREFVVDPAFPDGLDLLRARAHENLVVLRTFSKAYGLAGLRVGYCVGSPETVAATRRVQIPFGVSELAKVGAFAAMDSAAEFTNRWAQVAVERDRVRMTLLSMGFDVAPSHGNFVWLPLGDRTTQFARHCQDNGVVVRPITDHGIRVTTGLPAENDAFLAAAGLFTG
jgi:histidinol-phosphate aminotransferase